MIEMFVQQILSGTWTRRKEKSQIKISLMSQMLKHKEVFVYVSN